MRVVPLLPAETLLELVQVRGVGDCVDLLAAATPAQLASVLDLDMWRSAGAGLDDQFDVARFGEWIEGLVESGHAQAAIIVSRLDRQLVAAGLSAHIRVFDPAALFAPSSDSEGVGGGGPARGPGLSEDIGGYVVLARHPECWDAIVAVLVALESDHCGYFHAVMRACRRLSDSARETDGLDDLLGETDQLLHDAGQARHDRRASQGFLAPADARAYLQMARQPNHGPHPLPSVNPIAAAYARAGGEAGEAAMRPWPQALLGGSVAQAAPGADASQDRDRAFLVNVLMAGCSLQAGAFTPREASDAAASTCALGLELWSSRWPEEATPGLLPAFETGWATLHEASLFVAQQLIDVLKHVRSLDSKTHEGLVVLRRDLEKCCRAGTPWSARDALDVLAILDTVAWTGLLGVLDECPAVPDALTAIVERRRSVVSATAFEFVRSTAQLATIRAFGGRLADVFLGPF